MVVDPYLPALHSEEERVANLAFKVYFVADSEFLIRTFLPPADQFYRYRLIDVVFEFLAQLLKVIAVGRKASITLLSPAAFAVSFCFSSSSQFFRSSTNGWNFGSVVILSALSNSVICCSILM